MLYHEKGENIDIIFFVEPSYKHLKYPVLMFKYPFKTFKIFHRASHLQHPGVEKSLDYCFLAFGCLDSIYLRWNDIISPIV